MKICRYGSQLVRIESTDTNEFVGRMAKSQLRQLGLSRYWLGASHFLFFSSTCMCCPICGSNYRKSLCGNWAFELRALFLFATFDEVLYVFPMGVSDGAGSLNSDMKLGEIYTLWISPNKEIQLLLWPEWKIFSLGNGFPLNSLTRAKNNSVSQEGSNQIKTVSDGTSPMILRQGLFLNHWMIKHFL